MIKVLKYIGLLLLLIIGGAVVFNYHPDISVDRLKEKYTYADSRFVEVQGMEVHYRITGQGPTLILLHGTGASLHTWEVWTEELKNDFTLVSLDLPAFGLTGPFSDRDYQIRHYTEFLDTFTDALSLDSFALGGNSLGGLIAWRFALDYPDKVQQLVLLDAAGIPRKESGESPLAFRLAKKPAIAAIMQKVTPKALFKKSLYEVYGDPEKVTPALLQRYFELFRRPGNRQAYVDRINQEDTITDPDRLQEIAQPTLILWGETDAWIPVANARAMADRLPNDTLIIYPEVGHLPMEEIPVQTAEDVRAFLKKQQEVTAAALAPAPY
ncbi:MAG: alpha/beta hydrolase [Saprospiraceae bacterium]|nr:alpha/beta hydrolase [Saprospiraceae bacterium]